MSLLLSSLLLTFTVVSSLSLSLLPSCLSYCSMHFYSMSSLHSFLLLEASRFWNRDFTMMLRSHIRGKFCRIILSSVHWLVLDLHLRDYTWCSFLERWCPPSSRWLTIVLYQNILLVLRISERPSPCSPCNLVQWWTRIIVNGFCTGWKLVSPLSEMIPILRSWIPGPRTTKSICCSSTNQTKLASHMILWETELWTRCQLHYYLSYLIFQSLGTKAKRNILRWHFPISRLEQHSELNWKCIYSCL